MHNDILSQSWTDAEKRLTEATPYIVAPDAFSPSLQAKVLEIAKNFSAGDTSEILTHAAQRLAEAELMHQHAVSLVSKVVLVPWKDRHFLFNELQGLSAACQLWEADVS